MKLSEVIAFLESGDTYTIKYKGQTVKYINEAGSISDSSVFYIAGHEFGATHLIHVEAYRGDGFEAVWESWIDNAQTIPESELVEAYGTSEGSFLDMAHVEARGDNPPYGTPEWSAAMDRIHGRAKAMLEEAVSKAHEGNGEYPELIEGYEHQSNASGTGIVDVGHYSWMNEANLDEVEILP